MKFLQVLVLILCFVAIGNAQVDCGVINKVKVVDYDGNVIPNAKVDVLKVGKNFNRTPIFSLQKDNNNEFEIRTHISRLISGTEETYYIGENYRLRITAEDFKETERKIEFKRCESQEITIILEKIKQEIKLIGTIYDPNGALVPGVKLFARNKKGEVFETTSSITNKDTGSYELRLFPSEYELIFEADGFKKIVIPEYKLVNSTYGNMKLDITLEPRQSCPYAGPCEREKSNTIIHKKVEKYDKNY